MSNSTDKRKEEFHKALDYSRRAFLGGFGMFAASAAFVNLKGEAHAANEITPHRPERYGSAYTKFVKTTESNLGSSRIVGPIEQISEAQTGFNRAYLGEFGPQVAYNRTKFVGKYPLSLALSRTLSYLAADNIVDGPPPRTNCPFPIRNACPSTSRNLASFCALTMSVSA